MRVLVICNIYCPSAVAKYWYALVQWNLCTKQYAKPFSVLSRCIDCARNSNSVHKHRGFTVCIQSKQLCPVVRFVSVCLCAVRCGACVSFAFPEFCNNAHHRHTHELHGVRTQENDVMRVVRCRVCWRRECIAARRRHRLRRTERARVR